MILDESEVRVDDYQLLEGGVWMRERWWHWLTQVCQRWRNLVLQSASYLRLSLVCARGTPVSKMLANSPPFPLIIDHFDEAYRDLTTEDEEGITIALQHRDRVRRIRLMKPVPILQKLITALDSEFPILEFLCIQNERYHRPVIELTNLKIPEAFRAPHLRHLVIRNFAIPIGSPLLTTMRNLVTMSLNSIPPSAHFHPNALLQRISLMPQLETLGIMFNSYDPVRDVERHLLRTPIMTRVTLPNLRWLGFRGTSTYLEVLLPWVTIPLLEKLQVYFFNRLIYSIPHLQQFVSTAQNLRLKAARLEFRRDCLLFTAYPYKGSMSITLDMTLGGRHLDWQVVSAAQVFGALRKVFSTVEHLTLEYGRHGLSSEWNNEADRTWWRELLGSFGNVKTLRVSSGLVQQISRTLQPGEGESPTELLPDLQEISNFAAGSAFTKFIDARQKAGRPIILTKF